MFYLGDFWGGLCLADVAQHVRPVLQVDADLAGRWDALSLGAPPGPLAALWPPTRAHLDDVEAHVNDVLGAGAVVPGPGVTLEGVAEIPTVQVVVTQVIVSTPVGPGTSGHWPAVQPLTPRGHLKLS